MSRQLRSSRDRLHGGTGTSVRSKGSIRAKILVIDDEPLVLAALRRVLERDYDVCVESSGRAALARVRSGEAFDLVLCDLMMPDVTGMDVYAEIAAMSPALAARTVFMTGAPTTQRARDFVASGVRCIEKPFDLPELRRLTRSIIRSR